MNSCNTSVAKRKVALVKFNIYSGLFGDRSTARRGCLCRNSAHPAAAPLAAQSDRSAPLALTHQPFRWEARGGGGVKRKVKQIASECRELPFAFSWYSTLPFSSLLRVAHTVEIEKMRYFRPPHCWAFFSSLSPRGREQTHTHKREATRRPVRKRKSNLILTFFQILMKQRNVFHYWAPTNTAHGATSGCRTGWDEFSFLRVWRFNFVHREMTFVSVTDFGCERTAPFVCMCVLFLVFCLP